MKVTDTLTGALFVITEESYVLRIKKQKTFLKTPTNKQNKTTTHTLYIFMFKIIGISSSFFTSRYFYDYKYTRYTNSGIS